MGSSADVSPGGQVGLNLLSDVRMSVARNNLSENNETPSDE